MVFFPLLHTLYFCITVKGILKVPPQVKVLLSEGSMQSENNY